jgi:hypothetical protein
MTNLKLTPYDGFGAERASQSHKMRCVGGGTVAQTGESIALGFGSRFRGGTGAVTQIEIIVGVGGFFSSVGGEEKARKSAKEERGMALFFSNVGMISYQSRLV